MDKIIRTLVCGGQVSLAVIDAKDLVNEGAKIHSTDKTATKIFGGVLTCGAYLASLLKSDRGCVSLTVKAADGEGAVSVSADAAMHIRGYIDGSCNKSLSGGSLTVVREDGYSSMPFVGACEIEKSDISDILELYFGQSEQIPTAVCIDVDADGDGACRRAGGVIMQLLPDADEKNIQLAADAFYSFKESGDMSEGADKVFEKYFAKLAWGEINTIFPEYRCNCSEEKIRGVLASMGKAELINICKNQGKVSVHCHYCNKDYEYDEERIEEIF